MPHTPEFPIRYVNSDWKAPSPKPTVHKLYNWDENTLERKEIDS